MEEGIQSSLQQRGSSVNHSDGGRTMMTMDAYMRLEELFKDSRPSLRNDALFRLEFGLVGIDDLYDGVSEMSWIEMTGIVTYSSCGLKAA
jgi:hypothetical protein